MPGYICQVLCLSVCQAGGDNFGITQKRRPIEGF